VFYSNTGKEVIQESAGYLATEPNYCQLALLATEPISVLNIN